WRRHLKRREYPSEVASLDEVQPRFREVGEEEPTELSAFRSIQDAEARRAAHLGELLRARGKLGAAAAKFEQAVERIGARHAPLANKYALTLLALEEADRALEVLEASHALHPSDALTNLNLARA